MKKRAAVFSLLCILAVSFCIAASANSWGLTGKLYRAVEKSKAWEDYTALSKQAGSFAVMKARYHNALFFADGKDRLHVYTAAVYQPEDRRKAPKLYMEGEDLHLEYGDGEKYVFRACTESGEYHLLNAQIGGFSLEEIREDGESGVTFYRASEEGSTAVWPTTVHLSDFNIKLLPRSVEEVRHTNLMWAQFGSSQQCLGFVPGSGNHYSPDDPGKLLQPKKKGTAPVYSAPYGKSAWRAGKGKAAVGLNGDLWVLSCYRNEDGDSYACVRYDVSERTQRIGYTLCSSLGLPEITEWEPDEPLTGFARVDVEAVADTWLTDDPDVSQYQQFKVPEGTLFSCMGTYNDYYAYVAAEVKNGKFVDGGAIVWGFVPIRDLKPMEREQEPEVMSRLEGSWTLYAGGSLADDFLTFSSDGTFTAGSMDWDPDTHEQKETAEAVSGTWYVTKYNPFMNLYWNRPPYELTLVYDDGSVLMRGLDITEEGFSLTDAEGGGGYVPATDEEMKPAEDHG